MNGEQLRQERERLGLSQQRLAELLDVRQSTISEWERDKVTIRHEHILELAMIEVARRLGRTAGGNAAREGARDW